MTPFAEVMSIDYLRDKLFRSLCVYDTGKVEDAASELATKWPLIAAEWPPSHPGREMVALVLSARNGKSGFPFRGMMFVDPIPGLRFVCLAHGVGVIESSMVRPADSARWHSSIKTTFMGLSDEEQEALRKALVRTQLLGTASCDDIIMSMFPENVLRYKMSWHLPTNAVFTELSWYDGYSGGGSHQMTADALEHRNEWMSHIAKASYAQRS